MDSWVCHQPSSSVTVGSIIKHSQQSLDHDRCWFISMDLPWFCHNYSCSFMTTKNPLTVGLLQMPSPVSSKKPGSSAKSRQTARFIPVFRAEKLISSEDVPILTGNEPGFCEKNTWFTEYIHVLCDYRWTCTQRTGSCTEFPCWGIITPILRCSDLGMVPSFVATDTFALLVWLWVDIANLNFHGPRNPDITWCGWT